MSIILVQHVRDKVFNLCRTMVVPYLLCQIKNDLTAQVWDGYRSDQAGRPASILFQR